jgi:membrane-associated phospholipid phosphatase
MATLISASRFAAVTLCACLVCPAWGSAQTPLDGVPLVGPAGPSDLSALPLQNIFESPKPTSTGSGFWEPFGAVPRDFVRFFSGDTMKVMGVMGASALAAHQWDRPAALGSQEHLSRSVFRSGDTSGRFLVEVGAGFGLYTAAKLAGSTGLASVGADLVRAQILSQSVVQVGKFATRRTRPDGSNHGSLPSGHTSSAFATATVLQQHYGWKVGLPAYAFGAYVAASRMSANKHHLSDVLMGAGIGIAAGRTISVGSGRAKFNLGVAPTDGGAAIVFSKH